jgi:hypothetical protein
MAMTRIEPREITLLAMLRAKKDVKLTGMSLFVGPTGPNVFDRHTKSRMGFLWGHFLAIPLDVRVDAKFTGSENGFFEIQMTQKNHFLSL